MFPGNKSDPVSINRRRIRFTPCRSRPFEFEPLCVREMERPLADQAPRGVIS